MHLVLASASQGRKKLLEQLKIPFFIVPGVLDEEKIIAETPLATLKLRAKMKCQDVLSKISASPGLLKLPKQTNNLTMKQPACQQGRFSNGILILSADSGAILDNELIGRPKDYDEAVRILKKLSGRTHEFVTVIYFIKLIINNSEKNRKCGWREPLRQAQGKQALAPSKNRGDRTRIALEISDRSFVTFRKLSDDDIKRYLSIIDYTKFAGGYALYTGQDFITNVKGSLSNVIGLPLEKVLPVLYRYINLPCPRP